MATIEPNRRYRLQEAFGPDFHIMNYDEPGGDPFGRMLLGVPSISDRESQKVVDHLSNLSATFKGSHISMELDFEDYSLDNPERTSDGIKIYFPYEIPKASDMSGVASSHLAPLSFRTDKLIRLSFMVTLARLEDIARSEKGEMLRYRYDMLLKSNKGLYTSNATLPAVDNLPSAFFSDWYNESSKEVGELYIPLDLQKVGSLEIMLKECK